jgi:hypothetical protein
VNHRYAEARQIADGLAERGLRAVAESMAGAGPVIVNPSARTRGGLVEVVVDDDTPIPGKQTQRSRGAGPSESRRVRPSDVAALLGQIRGQRFSDNFFVTSLAIEDHDDGPEVVIHLDTKPAPDAAVEEARRELYARLGASEHEWFHVRMHRPAMQRLLARVEDIPGYGWRAWSIDACSSEAAVTVSENGRTLGNGLSTVEIDPGDGSFTLDGVDGLNRLVDDGEAGDTYNYCPPLIDRVVDEPTDVTITVLEPGPVRAVVAVDRTFTWPERVDDTSGERVGAVATVVRSRLELHAGERLVRITTSFDNHARDHRLRAWFPLSAPASNSRAECAFAIVERGLKAEGGPSEEPLATFPSRRFVTAGDVTVVHEGLLEYELVDAGSALALTLLRANGWLSRGPMATRAEPAGPVVALEGPQMQQRVEVRYGVSIGAIDPYRLVDEAFLPLAVVRSSGGGFRPPTGQELTVEGAEVSALRRGPGGLEVRVFNPSAETSTVRLPGRRGWQVDLRGRPLVAFEGSFELAPWRIATVRLDDEVAASAERSAGRGLGRTAG